MKLRRIIPVMTAALLLAACSKGSGSASESTSGTSAPSKTPTESSVRMNEKHAEFPEQLRGMTKADVLTNAVYSTFDAASLIVEPETQPFDGYKCTAAFDGCYIFKDDKGYGLLDSKGNVLIPSDGVKKITAVAPTILSVRYTDNSTVYYRISADSISEERVSFDKSRISFEQLMGGEDDMYDSQHFVIALDGETLYESKWLGYEELDPKSLDTAEDCAAVYKAWNGIGAYYLVFDRYCNLTVYEAEYAKVKLHIGDDYCECYITDPDDYDDLETLIGSFGSEERTDAPEHSGGSDYIRIEGGLAENTRWTRTVSPDGYCFTEIYPDENKADNGTYPDMYFTVMNPRTFIDLVSWTASATK